VSSGSGAKGGSAFEKGILLDGAAMGEAGKGGPAKYVCFTIISRLVEGFRGGGAAGALRGGGDKNRKGLCM
jgi:hypothetical protein